jgi:hypothetical protein
MLGAARGGAPAGSATGTTTIGEVKINPPTGPAVFHSVSPFPARVNLAGLTFVSTDDDGVRLHTQAGEITIFMGIADGNGDEGFELFATKGLLPGPFNVDLNFVRANGNGGDGIHAESENDVQLTNVAANGNTDAGARLRATEGIQVFSLPIDAIPFPPPAILQGFPGTTFNDNDTAGLIALASDPLIVGAFFFAPEGVGPPIEATGNGTVGLALQGNDTLFISHVQADDNQVGLRASTPGGIVVALSSASDNDLEGMDLTSTDPGDGEFDLAIIIASVSANRNMSTGLLLSTPNASVLVTDSSAIGNTNGLLIEELGPASSSLVNGNIICSNTTSGLRLTDNQAVNAEGNWWGDASGPLHAVNNPGGLGNAVVDGSSGGGAGTVDFLPFIDTITAQALNPFVEFQFSGGGGTVFLGNAFPNDLGGLLTAPSAAEPPFTLTTDNGVLVDSDETAPTVHERINQLNGIVRVRLQGSTLGVATVTLDGPCGLDSSVIVQVRRLTAPLLSPFGLVGLAATLMFAGITVLRRRQLS